MGNRLRAGFAKVGYEATGDALTFYNLPWPFAEEADMVLLDGVKRIGRLEH